MNYIVNDEEINLILCFLRMFFINIGTYYIFLRLINERYSKSKNIFNMLILVLVTVICTVVKEYINSMSCIILLLAVLTFIFSKITRNSIGYTIMTTISAFSISNILYFISIFLNSLPNVIFNIQNDIYALLLIVSIYCILIYMTMRIKRLKNGLSFLNQESQSEFLDILILNIGTIIIFFIVMFGNCNILIADKMVMFIFICSIIMFITIKKSFQVYYKQKLLIQEIEATKLELENKNQEIKKIEQENLNLSKKNHSIAHKQKLLEYKLNKLMLKAEFAGEIDIKDKLENITKELNDKIIIIDLAKTNIIEIDDMLEFMQSECIKNNIDFNLQIIGNIYYMINNLVPKEELEMLIADHIKDAIIAIKHTDNINKSILVKLGKIDEHYGLYIYDSGIEFEKQTLENLGKKPSTTYSNEGGTGMGFMNTFDVIRKHNASLIIKELGKPSKDNYTKIVMIKFDNQNEFKVISEN